VYLTLLLTAGCALSPQRVAIHPQLQVPPGAAQGNGTALALAVDDRRETALVGRRGGVYAETATISTADDVAAPLRQGLAAALAQMGYRVHAGTAAPRLQVSLIRLDYAVEKNKLTRTVTTTAAIEAVLRIGTKSYTNVYKLGRSRKMLTAPDAGDNEELINETLAAALQRLLEDEELFGHLREGGGDGMTAPAEGRPGA
jgi:uncharacterized lipoprotein